MTSIIAKDNGKNAHVGSRTTGPRKELHMESIWFKISMPAPVWRGLRQRSKAKELLSTGMLKVFKVFVQLLARPMCLVPWWQPGGVLLSLGVPPFVLCTRKVPRAFAGGLGPSGRTGLPWRAQQSDSRLGYTCVNELVILICREIYMCALAARRRSSTNPLFSEIWL